MNKEKQQKDAEQLKNSAIRVLELEGEVVKLRNEDFKLTVGDDNWKKAKQALRSYKIN